MISLNEHADCWEIEVSGWELTRCVIGYSFILRLAFDNDLVEFQIEQAFRLEDQGQSFEFTPKLPADMASATLHLLHKKAVSARAYKAGTLDIRFLDGSSVVVPPHERFEAWNATGTGGLIIVCIPGGELAVWLPQEEDE